MDQLVTTVRLYNRPAITVTTPYDGTPKCQSAHTERVREALIAESAAHATVLAHDGAPEKVVRAVRARSFTPYRPPAMPRPVKSHRAPRSATSWVEWIDPATWTARQGVVTGRSVTELRIIPADGGDEVTAVRHGDGFAVDGAPVRRVSPPN